MTHDDLTPEAKEALTRLGEGVAALGHEALASDAISPSQVIIMLYSRAAAFSIALGVDREEAMTIAEKAYWYAETASNRRKPDIT